MSRPKRLRAIKDRRSTWARRHQELADAFAADLGPGCSAADRSLVDHAATVAVECERMKARQLNDQAIDLDELVRLTNALTRVRKELDQHAERDKRDPVAESWQESQEQFEKDNQR